MAYKFFNVCGGVSKFSRSLFFLIGAYIFFIVNRKNVKFHVATFVLNLMVKRIFYDSFIINVHETIIFLPSIKLYNICIKQFFTGRMT